MLSCKEISHLVGESLDHKLPWRVRMEMRMHLLMCRFCGGFARQFKQLRRALQTHPERLVDTDPQHAVTLSNTARQRIQELLERDSSER